jgi:hypothetical protein
MAELKTKENDASVTAFLDGVGHPARREDGKVLRQMMEKITGETARMWGANIVGFGRYSYVYASGHSGEWPLTGFSPRKASFSIYIMPGFRKSAPLLKKLGKHKIGKSCLYVNHLEDVDLEVLEKLIKDAFEEMRRKHEA